MKLPRDISASELVSSLRKFDYQVTRQNPIKLGTLSSILADIAAHFGLTKEETAEKLFG
jgi:hypothetical protein